MSTAGTQILNNNYVHNTPTVQPGFERHYHPVLSDVSHQTSDNIQPKPDFTCKSGITNSIFAGKKADTMKNRNRIASAIDLSEIMYAHALRLTNDKYLAEKLVQETMLQIKEKAATYIAGMPFVTWIKMIMENTYLATFKDADLQQLHRLCFCGSTNLFAINCHDTYSTKDIYLVMSRLSPGQATAVTLRLQGYKPNEIARIMGITTQHALNHLSEATYNLIHTWDN